MAIESVGLDNAHFFVKTFIPFRLMAKSKLRFSIFGLFHRLYRGSEVMMRSDFFKGVFVQTESSGKCFDHGQFEIKTFHIYAPP